MLQETWHMATEWAMALEWVETAHNPSKLTTISIELNNPMRYYPTSREWLHLWRSFIKNTSDAQTKQKESRHNGMKPSASHTICVINNLLWSICSFQLARRSTSTYLTSLKKVGRLRLSLKLAFKKPNFTLVVWKCHCQHWSACLRQLAASKYADHSSFLATLPSLHHSYQHKIRKTNSRLKIHCRQLTLTWICLWVHQSTIVLLIIAIESSLVVRRIHSSCSMLMIGSNKWTSRDTSASGWQISMATAHSSVDSLSMLKYLHSGTRGILSRQLNEQPDLCL